MDISLDWLNQHKPGNTAKFFNLEFLEKIDNTFKIKVTFPPESTNPMNMVQGGMIAAAMDDATAMVIISAYELKRALFRQIFMSCFIDRLQLVMQ